MFDNKRGSDGLDIVRLVQTADWDAMATDVGGVDGLGAVVEWAGDVVLVRNAARVARLIQVHTDERPPTPDDVRALGRALTALARQPPR